MLEIKSYLKTIITPTREKRMLDSVFCLISSGTCVRFLIDFYSPCRMDFSTSNFSCICFLEALIFLLDIRFSFDFLRGDSLQIISDCAESVEFSPIVPKLSYRFCCGKDSFDFLFDRWHLVETAIEM